jgi:hypothetical protein
MSIKTNIQARSGFDILDPKIDQLIELSRTRLLPDSFDTNATYEYAVALLVMHWLALNKQSACFNNMGGVGGVKSISEGQLSISFGALSGSNFNSMLSDLQQTSFGVELASLLETAIIPPATRFG